MFDLGRVETHRKVYIYSSDKTNPNPNPDYYECLRLLFPFLEASLWVVVTPVKRISQCPSAFDGNLVYLGIDNPSPLVAIVPAWIILAVIA